MTARQRKSLGVRALDLPETRGIALCVCLLELPPDLYGMRPLLRLGTSIGEAFERNWATCQQLADEGTQDHGSS